jgi:hypothetical protein
MLYHRTSSSGDASCPTLFQGNWQVLDTSIISRVLSQKSSKFSFLSSTINPIIMGIMQRLVPQKLKYSGFFYKTHFCSDTLYGGMDSTSIIGIHEV